MLWSVLACLSTPDGISARQAHAQTPGCPPPREQDPGIHHMADAKDISRKAFIITFGVQLILLTAQGLFDIPLMIVAHYLLPIGTWSTIIGLAISFGFGLRSLTTSKEAL